ncbi:MAG: branched-chain amino acid ABC transporter ATP-binding protein/permease [Candidatus Caldarchaeum sp.]
MRKCIRFLAIYLACGLILLALPKFISLNALTILTLANIWAVFAMSWDILAYTGQISFGHSFFIGLGGYASALIALYGKISPWIAMPLGGLAAALGGLVIAAPALRLHGPYLALITLLAALVLDKVVRLLRIESAGAEGTLLGIPPLSFDWTENYYYSVGLMLSIAGLLWLITRSHLGEIFTAIRDDKEAAAAAGFHTAKYKMVSFALSGFTAGLAGAFLAHYMMAISPALLLNLDLSVETIIAAVIGGMNTITGPIAGGYFLVLVREYLRPLGEWRFFALTALTIIVLFLLPRGFWTELRLLIERLKSKIAKPSSSWGTFPMRNSSAKKKEKGGTVILEVRQLRKAFGGLVALNDLSFTVHEGEILGLIGPNGAGKTTVFNVITGLYQPDGGRVIFKDRDITGWPTHKVVRAGIARTFQIPRPFHLKTTLQNVAVPALPDSLWPYGISSSYSHALLWCTRVGLSGPDLLKLPAMLPQAGLRRLEIARALAADPQLLLLDEPFAGLSAKEVEELSELIRQLRDEGRTIVLVDHNMRGVMQLVNRVVVMHFGQKLAEGTPEQVWQNKAVQEAYLAGGGIER